MVRNRPNVVIRQTAMKNESRKNAAASFWKNAMTRSAIQGGLLAAYSMYADNGFYMNVDLLNIIQTSMSLPMVNFFAGFGAGIVNDTVHSYVLPNIPQNRKYAAQEAAILSPLISSASLGGMLYLMNPSSVPSYGMFRIIGSAVLADITSHYIQDNFVTGMIN